MTNSLKLMKASITTLLFQQNSTEEEMDATINNSLKLIPWLEKTGVALDVGLWSNDLALNRNKLALIAKTLRSHNIKLIGLFSSTQNQKYFEGIPLNFLREIKEIPSNSQSILNPKQTEAVQPKDSEAQPLQSKNDPVVEKPITKTTVTVNEKEKIINNNINDNSKAPQNNTETKLNTKPLDSSFGEIITKIVRSGQQLYSKHDITITSNVSDGAELISEGSIHVYGKLNGRAMAGSTGNKNARIFCSNFNAQLVSIAGEYKVFDTVPPEILNKAVQIFLDQNGLSISLLK